VSFIGGSFPVSTPIFRSGRVEPPPQLSTVNGTSPVPESPYLPLNRSALNCQGLNGAHCVEYSGPRITKPWGRERFRTSDPYRVKLRQTRFTVFSS
jgi:hypothetical protein